MVTESIMFSSNDHDIFLISPKYFLMNYTFLKNLFNLFQFCNNVHSVCMYVCILKNYHIERNINVCHCVCVYLYNIYIYIYIYTHIYFIFLARISIWMSWGIQTNTHIIYVCVLFLFVTFVPLSTRWSNFVSHLHTTMHHGRCLMTWSQMQKRSIRTWLYLTGWWT